VISGHFSRLRTKLAVALLAPAIVVPLLGPSGPASASCGRPSGCNRYELIHAGATYDWYPAARRFEFKHSDGRRPPRAWSHAGSRPTEWDERFGTLKVEQRSGDSVTDWRQSHRLGRWEVRFRSKTGTPHTPAGTTPYAVKIELVPAGTPATRCSSESVLMAGYNPATTRRTARIGVTRPGFRSMAAATTNGPLYDVTTWNGAQNTRQGAWRAWAVEVGRNHISWFLDGRVVRRENRPAALIGKPLHLRISLLSTRGREMAPATTQLDWARYWSLKRTTHARQKVRALRSAPGLATVSRSPAPGC
jgi:hypothetical protein